MTVSPEIAPEQVRQTILALVTNVDVRELDASARQFAPEVRADYTSLWGGEAQVAPREDMIAGWRSVLPGFDATRHQLGAIEVQVEGDRATAECDVDALHWLDGGTWRVRGRYRFALARTERWRVT